MRRSLLASAIVLGALFIAADSALAETFTTGQVVFASPSGASNNWYSGCIVGSGRSNRSYQVECAGTTWWISGDNISTRPPAPVPDPMHPGQTLTPVITPSHVAKAAAQGPPRGAAAGQATTPVRVAANTGTYAGANSAAEMHRRIEQDKVDAKTATLKSGKYSCYAGGRYTFSDLYILGPNSYRVEPGGSGSYSYKAGALTFASGPYAGAYSRMVDGHTIGISAKGNTNLGTQCELSS